MAFTSPNSQSSSSNVFFKIFFSQIILVCGELLGSQESFLRINQDKKDMSRRNGNGPKLDLRLNLSPPRVINHHHHIDHQQHPISPNRSMTTSPTSSCVSSEDSPARQHRHHTNSPETPTTSMVLVGCPRCLMYVMLAEADPRCPKCKSTCLLDVIYESNNTSTTTTRRRIT